MKTPFTLEQFLNVFKEYNNNIWPLQIILFLLGAIIIYLVIRRKSFSNKVISSVLAFFWLWMGIVYHLVYFSVINKAAFGFGLIFIVEGILLIYYGVIKSKLSFQFRTDVSGLIGAILLLYALIIYPILGFALGHVYPSAPTFGLPCPTTIFTLSLFLFTDKKIPLALIVIPVIWSVIGFMAALNFGILEDIGLIATGLIVSILFVIRYRSH